MHLSCRLHYHRYVENNGHNCEELLSEFEADVAKDGRIDLHSTGNMSSFLSVRYLSNSETGEITPAREAYLIPCSLYTI
jgi:hypothetical protein